MILTIIQTVLIIAGVLFGIPTRLLSEEQARRWDDWLFGCFSNLLKRIQIIFSNLSIIDFLYLIYLLIFVAMYNHYINREFFGIVETRFLIVVILLLTNVSIFTIYRVVHRRTLLTPLVVVVWALGNLIGFCVIPVLYAFGFNVLVFAFLLIIFFLINAIFAYYFVLYGNRLLHLTPPSPLILARAFALIVAWMCTFYIFCFFLGYSCVFPWVGDDFISGAIYFNKWLNCYLGLWKFVIIFSLKFFVVPLISLFAATLIFMRFIHLLLRVKESCNRSLSKALVWFCSGGVAVIQIYKMWASRLPHIGG